MRELPILMNGAMVRASPIGCKAARVTNAFDGEPSFRERMAIAVSYARTRRMAVTRDDLIARFGCSRATAYRYLHALRTAGVIDSANRPIRPSPARSTNVEHC